MWLAVVGVFTSSVKLSSVLLAWGIEVVLVAEGFGIDTRGDGILVEDNVVWITSVIDPSDTLALGDGDGGWLENEATCTNWRVEGKCEK